MENEGTDGRETIFHVFMFTHAAQYMYRAYRSKYLSIFLAMDLVKIILAGFT
jgi:hypothetical protein